MSTLEKIRAVATTYRDAAERAEKATERALSNPDEYAPAALTAMDERDAARSALLAAALTTLDEPAAPFPAQRLVFKHEDEVEGMAVGPLYLRPSGPRAPKLQWIDLGSAQRLAAALGLDLVEG